MSIDFWLILTQEASDLRTKFTSLTVGRDVAAHQMLDENIVSQSLSCMMLAVVIGLKECDSCLVDQPTNQRSKSAVLANFTNPKHLRPLYRFCFLKNIKFKKKGEKTACHT